MPERRLRMTSSTLAVLRVLHSAAGDPVWGFRIIERTGQPPGTVYPVLKRLQEAGWVAAEWEAEQPEGRPRRRLYELTEHGRSALEAAVAASVGVRRRWEASGP
jgi:PadR family transcriptional regulator, regulatory protein PadR